MAKDKPLSTTVGEHRDRAPDAEARDPRAAQDAGLSVHADEARETAEQMLDFRSEWLQEALPKPPEIPGYHLCWLSTTNQYDPIHKRIRMGYAPVKIEEVPGLETYKVHSGEHAGYVSVNEMLLFKIPMERYQQIMRHFHHDMPLEEERAIRERAEQLAENTRDSAGKQLVQVEEGVSELGRVRRAPIFH